MLELGVHHDVQRAEQEQADRHGQQDFEQRETGPDGTADHGPFPPLEPDLPVAGVEVVPLVPEAAPDAAGAAALAGIAALAGVVALAGIAALAGAAACRCRNPLSLRSIPWNRPNRNCSTKSLPVIGVTSWVLPMTVGSRISWVERDLYRVADGAFAGDLDDDRP